MHILRIYGVRGQHTRVLDCAVVRLRTVYLAIESTASAGGEPYVSVVVCHLDYDHSDRFDFGYKDDSEQMGPVEDECPERILNLLSATEHANTIQWRERCWARTQRRKSHPSLKGGSYLLLDSPVEFADGVSREVFYIEDAKRRQFLSMDGKRCKIPRSVLEESGYSVREDRPEPTLC